MNNDDIEYLKGFTVMGRRDAIAEAWEILKAQEDGMLLKLLPPNQLRNHLLSGCPGCVKCSSIDSETGGAISDEPNIAELRMRGLQYQESGQARIAQEQEASRRKKVSEKNRANISQEGDSKVEDPWWLKIKPPRE